MDVDLGTACLSHHPTLPFHREESYFTSNHWVSFGFFVIHLKCHLKHTNHFAKGDAKEAPIVSPKYRERNGFGHKNNFVKIKLQVTWCASMSLPSFLRYFVCIYQSLFISVVCVHRRDFRDLQISWEIQIPKNPHPH